MRTQWRQGPAGATGLDYGAVVHALRLRGVERRAEIFEDLQVMEEEILTTWARERQRSRR